MFRVIKEVKPTFIIAENVRGIVNIQDGLVFETVCSDLESEGFEIQPFIIPGAGVGAPIKENESGLWATPNTMDHLPPRSEEGTKKLMQGHGRDGQTIESQRASGSSNDEVMENSRRTLRQGTSSTKRMQ